MANEKKPNDNEKIKRVFKIVLIIILSTMLIIGLVSIFNSKNKDSKSKSVAYTQLIKDIDDGKIKKIKMTVGSTTINVVYKDGMAPKVTENEDLKNKTNVLENNETENSNNISNSSEIVKNTTNNESSGSSTNKGNTTDDTTASDILDDDEEEKLEKENTRQAIVPNTQAFIELIQEKIKNGGDFELIQNPQNQLIIIGEKIFGLLPTIILLVLFYLIFQMQGLGEKGKVYDPAVTNDKITFDDVAGLDEEKGEMLEIVDFLKNSEKYTKMGAKIPKGVLLCGKPGTGKTLIAKAIAGEAEVPFISMSGSEFIELFAGLGASRVRKLFEKAQKLSPCIIFIDEIDAIGSRRQSMSGGDTENNQTLNQLLVEMDGFTTDQSVIVIAATNRPEMLDEALLRPGRFDRRINIGLPDIGEREAILKLHAKNKNISEYVDLRSIAGDTAGFSGAELANILNEAAIFATNRKHDAITNQDIEDAVRKVTVGLEKHNRIVSEKDKKLTAYHEAGHAVVSKYLPTQDLVKEVSIIPRGVAGGYTMYKTLDDKFYVSKNEMEEKLVSLFGGRAAEKVALNDISTGASNDIEVAMKVARDMIIVYGMSEKIGPMSLKLDENDTYAQLELLGNNIEDEIGKEVREVLDRAYKAAQEILIEHRDKLDAVAKILLEKEKINEEEFDKIFNDNAE